MYIRSHVTLVYPIYPPLFAFQSEHNLEMSCLLTSLVWARRWGEHGFFLFREVIYERACTLQCHAYICRSVHCDTVATCTTQGLISPVLSWTLGRSLVMSHYWPTQPKTIFTKALSSKKVHTVRAPTRYDYSPDLRQTKLFFIIVNEVNERVFCQRAGLSLQTQEPRLQFYHGLNRCSSFPFLSVPHSLFSIWTHLRRCEKIPGAPTWRWKEWICLTGHSGLHRNSPQGLNISSIRVFD